MILSTNKQMRNILTVRKHRRQANRKMIKEARRIMGEQIALACSCPACKPRTGNA